MKDLCVLFENRFDLSLTFFGIAQDKKSSGIVPAFYAGPASGYITAETSRPYNPDITIPEYHVLTSGHYYYAEDLSVEAFSKEWSETAAFFGFKSFLVVPLISGKTAKGILGLYSKTPAFLKEKDLLEIVNVSEDIADFLFSKGLHPQREVIQRELIDSYKVLSEQKEKEIILNQFSRGIIHSLSEEEVISSALDSIHQALNPDAILLFMEEETGFSVNRVASYNKNLENWKSEKPFKKGECLCGFAALKKEAVYAEDISSDQRCTLNSCKLAGARSFAAIPLVINNKNIGLIGVASAEKRNFKKYSTFLETLGIQCAIGLKNAQLYNDVREKALLLEKKVKTKDTLLKEVHHRIKNNLNVIGSLLNLQLQEIEKGANPREAFMESRNRVFTMSKIHEKLYQTDNFSEIEMAPFIEMVSRELVSTYSLGGEISLITDIDPLSFPMSTAVPFGLLLNEIITNSMKYAFPEKRNGSISVVLKKQGETILFKVHDNGIGITPERKDTMDSLGLTLIQLLTDQLEGVLTINGTKGTSVIIEFPFSR